MIEKCCSNQRWNKYFQMTKLVSIEEIQSVATYNCDQSNKGNKYPDDIVRGGHPAA